MTDPPLGTITPVQPERTLRPLALSALLAAVGVTELLALYALLRPHLPAQVPMHYGLLGQPSSFASPESFLLVQIGILLSTSLVFALLLWGIGRTPTLSAAHRGWIEYPLLGIQGAIVVGVLPGLSALELGSSAGWWSLGVPGFALLVAVVSLLPLLVIALLLLRRSASPFPRSPARAELTSHPWMPVGGPIELQCTACGQRFQLSGVPLFAPHLAVPGNARLYVRCSLCGERGWDPVLARVNAA